MIARAVAVTLCALALGFGQALAQALPPAIRIAGISQAELAELQQQVRRSAEVRQVSERALARITERLGVAFTTNGRPNIDLVLQRIDQQAAILNDLQARLSRQAETDDPEIASLLAAARTAIDAGELERADTILGRAAEADLRAIATDANVRRSRAASTIAERARLASVQVQYLSAAALYAEAATTAPQSDSLAVLRYRLGEGMAFANHGNGSGSVDSNLRAIGLLTALLPSVGREHIAEWRDVRIQLFDVLLQQGAARGDNDLLERARDIAHELIRATPRESDPTLWGRYNFALSSVLTVLGGHERSERMLEESITAARSTLEVASADQEPTALGTTHAMILRNIGEAYLRLGIIRQDPELKRTAFLEAETTFRAALVRNPTDRENAQINVSLLNALRWLRTVENDVARAQEALDLAEAITARFLYEDFPVEWTQAKWYAADIALGLARSSQGEDRRRYYDRAERDAHDATISYQRMGHTDTAALARGAYNAARARR